MTEMSCISRTANEARPPPVPIRPFSVRVCSTIAVEERARIRPAASDTFQSRPRSIAPAVTMAAVIVICRVPRPTTWWRMPQKAFGSRPRPMTNSIITTPNSARL